MINWRSLFLFIFTLVLILGIFSGTAIFGYSKALNIAQSLQPHVFMTPSGAAVYVPNVKTLKEFFEYKYGDQGYSIYLPEGSTVSSHRESGQLVINEKDEKWTIVLNEKLLRHDSTIESNGTYLNNPEGDYYALMKRVFNERVDPILLFQKTVLLSSTTTAVKNIQTPSFEGFYIISSGRDIRRETYYLFDDLYWHTVNVIIYDPDYPHWRIQTIIGSLKNDFYAPEVIKKFDF
jgi:hypothetical protein